MVSLAIGKGNCQGCGKPVDIIELEGFPAPRPHCSSCLVKDAQEAQEAKPKLMSHMMYKVTVRASREARYEGDFSPVAVNFKSLFLGWTQVGDDEYALFRNGVEVGPRKELGYSWYAVQI